MTPTRAGLVTGFAILVLTSWSAGQPPAVPAGKMYWTDLSARKIHGVNLDGTGLEDIVTQGLRFPRALAFDIRRLNSECLG